LTADSFYGFLEHMIVSNRSALRLVSVVALIGLLSGCAILERQSNVKPTAPVKTEEETSQPSSPRQPPVPPAKPPVAQLDPQRLVGLNENAVTDLIGSPSEVRDEPPARVWRYNGNKCSVDVLFYFDLTQQEFRALTYSVEPAGRSDLAQRICLGGIQEAQRGGTKR
jgi:hypothetical protein